MTAPSGSKHNARTVLLAGPHPDASVQIQRPDPGRAAAPLVSPKGGSVILGPRTLGR